MGYQCQLNTENVENYKSAISFMYKQYSVHKSWYVACLFIVWFFEYFCAYQFINTSESVEFSKVYHKWGGHRDLLALISCLRNIRNTFIHEMCRIDKLKAYIEIAKTHVKEEGLDEVSSVFGKDKSEFKSMLISILNDLDINTVNTGCTQSDLFEKMSSEIRSKYERGEN